MQKIVMFDEHCTSIFHFNITINQWQHYGVDYKRASMLDEIWTRDWVVKVCTEFSVKTNHRIKTKCNWKIEKNRKSERHVVTYEFKKVTRKNIQQVCVSRLSNSLFRVSSEGVLRVRQDGLRVSCAWSSMELSPLKSSNGNLEMPGKHTQIPNRPEI